MSQPRKKWKLTYYGIEGEYVFTSQRKAYAFIRDLARSYATDPEGMSRDVHVWVMEPRGRDGWDWHSFEVVDLTEVGEAS